MPSYAGHDRAVLSLHQLTANTEDTAKDIKATKKEELLGKSKCLERVYILGCFERRRTIYSQQVRALNLIHTIYSMFGVQRNPRLAVIGAGPAGLTAAVAAANLGFHTTVYEHRRPFDTFLNASSREVHPRLFEWPNEGWHLRNAGLPFFNWTAGSIGEVRKGWMSELKAHENQLGPTGTGKLHLVTGSPLIDLTFEKPRVVLDNDSQMFNVVIIAVGFGDESFPAESVINRNNGSFWAMAPAAPNGPDELVEISGMGDGAVQDLLLSTISDFSWDDIAHILYDLDQELDALKSFTLRMESSRYDSRTLDFRYQSESSVNVGPLVEVFSRRLNGRSVRICWDERHLVSRSMSPVNRILLLNLLKCEQHGLRIERRPRIKLVNVTENDGLLHSNYEKPDALEPYRSVPGLHPANAVFIRHGFEPHELTTLFEQSSRDAILTDAIESLRQLVGNNPALAAPNCIPLWRFGETDTYREHGTLSRLNPVVRASVEATFQRQT